MMQVNELCSFSNLSGTSPTSQLILKPFRRFNYITAHSLTLPLLHLCHSSFSNPSFASPTSQALRLIHLAELILQPFHHFTYITTHSPTLLSLYLHHNSFSNTFVASPTSQFILQPFFRFPNVTSSSLTSPSELPMISSRIPICPPITSHPWTQHRLIPHPSSTLPSDTYNLLSVPCILLLKKATCRLKVSSTQFLFYQLSAGPTMSISCLR